MKFKTRNSLPPEPEIELTLEVQEKQAYVYVQSPGESRRTLLRIDAEGLYRYNDVVGYGFKTVPDPSSPGYKIIRDVKTDK